MLRQYISEVEAERIIDRRVMHRLAIDHAYKNAEDAESQAAREEEITALVMTDVARKFKVDGWTDPS